MKPNTRELLADLKAAALIGDPDSVAIVMERVRQSSDQDLPPSALLPLGQALGGLGYELVAHWLLDKDPAVRGIAAAALGYSSQQKKYVPDEILFSAADDPTPEVRTAFISALSSDNRAEISLIEKFLNDDSSLVQQSGLKLLAQSGERSEKVLSRLKQLDSAADYELRTVLVESLSQLAETGWSDFVMDLMGLWAGREEPNVWVITRLASAGWALNHSARILPILQKLGEKVGVIRAVQRAMDRH